VEQYSGADQRPRAMESGKQAPPDAPKVKLSTTCTTCRERHLRCDGPPICSRCRADGASCMFVETRRGKRAPGPRRAANPTPLALSPNLERSAQAAPMQGSQGSAWNAPFHMPPVSSEYPAPSPFSEFPPILINVCRRDAARSSGALLPNLRESSLGKKD